MYLHPLTRAIIPADQPLPTDAIRQDAKSGDEGARKAKGGGSRKGEPSHALPMPSHTTRCELDTHTRFTLCSPSPSPSHSQAVALLRAMRAKDHRRAMRAKDHREGGQLAWHQVVVSADSAAQSVAK